jgi:hypothetical protein
MSLPVSTDALLIADGPEEKISKWAFQNEPPRLDELLSYAMEEK